MAGFGGGSSKKTGGKKGKGKGPVTQKLKPKSQWDKYKRFKKSSSVKVAVRVAADAESDAGDWYEVGKIKSDGDEFTELAVVLQRGIIAEHAKRLEPLQFLPKYQVEWGYASADDEWIVVDKNVANSAPSGVEKKIGFQGNPDKSGFYTKTIANFAGEKATAPLASGSDMLDNSVLPRIK